MAGAFLRSIDLVEEQLATAANNPSAVARSVSILAELRGHVEGSLKFSDPESHEMQQIVRWIASLEKSSGAVERKLTSMETLIKKAKGKPEPKPKA